MASAVSGASGRLVFISKASADLEVALHAASLVEQAGMRAWVSERDVTEGRDHAAAAMDAIGASDVVLVLLSAKSVESPWVLREVEQAIASRTRLVPVALPSFPGMESLPQGWKFRLLSSQVRVDGDLGAVIASLASGDATDLRGRLADPAPARHESPCGEAVRRDPLEIASKSARGFVGRERQQILDQLLANWREVAELGSPRLVVLLGETGFGKTRIVQELYRSLAATQPTPEFWPSDLVASHGSGDLALRESRKRVSPNRLGPPPGARATYLWLGHEVDEGHGRRVDAGLGQLGADMARALALAAAEPGGRAERMIKQALGSELGAGVDGEGAVVDLLHGGTAGTGPSVAPGSLEAFWQGIRALWASADAESPPPLPAVVCVEDGHFAGQQTVTALEQLVSSGDLPFLVVVCAQESQLGGESEPGDPGVAGRSPLGRLIDLGLSGVSVVRLARLPDSDIRSLFLESIPDVDADAVHEAVRKVDGNPYHAHTLLAEMVRAAQGGRLDAAWVRRRPASFEEELRLQWRMLPDEIRRLLSGMAVLGTQVPERIGLHAIGAVFEEPEPAVDASLKTGWLRRLATDEALRFLERPRWVIAHAESFEEWYPEERRQIIRGAIDTLEALALDVGGLTEPLLQELHLAMGLAADRESVEFDRAAAVRSGLASALRLYRAADDAGSQAVIRDVERLFAGHLGNRGLGALGVESALALHRAIVQEGQVESTHPRALEVAELAVVRAHMLGSSRPGVTARAYAALCRSHRVRFDQERLALAAGALSSAESWLERATSADIKAQAEVSHARAVMATAAGDFARGAEVSEMRLRLLEQLFGTLDRRSISALLNLAYYWGRLDIDRCLGLRRELLDRMLHAWADPEHPQVALAQKEVAFTLSRLSDQSVLDEAIALASSALDSLTRTRGARHRRTNMARAVWGIVALRLSDRLEGEGLDEQARTYREQALAAAQQNLEYTASSAPPSTMLVRQERLGSALARLADPRGVEILAEVLAVREGAGSDGHGDTPSVEVLWTAADVVAGLWRLGREEEALEVVARLPMERAEEWPAVHPRGWRSTRPEDARIGVL